jgi:hypothetical protein
VYVSVHASLSLSVSVYGSVFACSRSEAKDELKNEPLPAEAALAICFEEYNSFGVAAVLDKFCLSDLVAAKGLCQVRSGSRVRS